MTAASSIPSIGTSVDGPVGALNQGQAARAAKSSSKDFPKLVQAAGEFESMLLESLWKSMKETFTDPNNPDSDATLQSFDDWGMKSMAEAVGNSGGLGIKNMIIKYLEPTLTSASPIPAAKA
jgi:Rod binding domain-containing protein